MTFNDKKKWKSFLEIHLRTISKTDNTIAPYTVHTELLKECGIVLDDANYAFLFSIMTPKGNGYVEFNRELMENKLSEFKSDIEKEEIERQIRNSTIPFKIATIAISTLAFLLSILALIMNECNNNFQKQEIQQTLIQQKEQEQQQLTLTKRIDALSIQVQLLKAKSDSVSVPVSK